MWLVGIIFAPVRTDKRLREAIFRPYGRTLTLALAILTLTLMYRIGTVGRRGWFVEKEVM